MEEGECIKCSLMISLTVVHVDHRPPQHIFKLSDISGPIVPFQIHGEHHR